MNNPLSRVGVSLSWWSLQKVKFCLLVGCVVCAQRIILKSLKKEFGE